MLDDAFLGLGGDAPFATPAEEPILEESIRTIVHGEPFAVLCTQLGGQPYASLVSFAFSQNLRSFAFATPVATRKYRLLCQCDRVALLVDNRGNFPDDMMRVSALTVTGRACRVEPNTDYEHWAGLLTTRHPYLNTFVQAPSTALFRVDVVRFLHVTRFQEVRQWIPPADG